MKISLRKKQARFLNEVIQHWGEEALIDDATKGRLTNSIEVRPFDWKKLAEYSFWISIICIIISLVAVVADEALIHFVEQFFSASNLMLCLTFAVIAGGFYYWGYVSRKKFPHRTYSNEFIVVLGVLSTATAIAFLGKALDNGSGHFSLLFLLATIVYGIVGLVSSSNLIWNFALLSLGAWFGAETGYVSDWGGYYLGMNYPLRFVLFGMVLTALSFLFGRFTYLQGFRKSTYTLGLLYFFIALWILSIFGNYGDIYEWEQVGQISLLAWGLIFGAVAIMAIAYGLKFDDYISRSYGITFLFLNLYTRYFEYFWDITHKTIFFLVLAITFWVIGKNAERIWNLSFINRKELTEEE